MARSFYYITQSTTYSGIGTYYSNYRKMSTTTASNDYNNWDYINGTTGTTCSQSYWQQSAKPYYVQYYDEPVIKYKPNETVIHKPSEQELLERQKIKAKELEIAEKAKIEAKIAEEKARSLLLEYVDSENKQRLIDKKPLEVPSRLFGDVVYQIPISGGRIKALKGDKIVTELCLTLSTPELLPSDDIVLTKLLHTVHDEENMLRTAKHWNVKEDLMARLN